MTPEQYIRHLEELIRAGRDHEALEYSVRHRSAVAPPLSADEFDHVTAMMEGAIMLVKLDEWAEAQSKAEARDLPPPEQVAPR